MNHFLYTRKSTDVEDKQVPSIEAQLGKFRVLAKEERLEIAGEFIETRTAKLPPPTWRRGAKAELYL